MAVEIPLPCSLRHTLVGLDLASLLLLTLSQHVVWHPCYILVNGMLRIRSPVYSPRKNPRKENTIKNSQWGLQRSRPRFLLRYISSPSARFPRDLNLHLRDIPAGRRIGGGLEGSRALFPRRQELVMSPYNQRPGTKRKRNSFFLGLILIFFSEYQGLEKPWLRDPYVAHCFSVDIVHQSPSSTSNDGRHV